jgi:hypothetical protein
MIDFLTDLSLASIRICSIYLTVPFLLEAPAFAQKMGKPLVLHKENPFGVIISAVSKLLPVAIRNCVATQIFPCRSVDVLVGQCAGPIGTSINLPDCTTMAHTLDALIVAVGRLDRDTQSIA